MYRSKLALGFKLCLVGLLAFTVSISKQRDALAWQDVHYHKRAAGSLGQCASNITANRGSGSGIRDYGAYIQVGSTYVLGSIIAIRRNSSSSAFTRSGLTAVSASYLQTTCNLQNVTNLQQTFDGTRFANLTTISLSFRAVLPIGQSAFASAGNVAGDGKAYDFVYSLISPDANSQPVITATVTPVNTGPSAEDSKAAAANFMLIRAQNIFSNQPNIIGFVDGTANGGGGPLGNLALNATEDSQVLAFSTSRSKVLASMDRTAASRINSAFGPTSVLRQAQGEGNGVVRADASTNTHANLLGYAADTKQTDEPSDDTLAVGYSSSDESRAGSWDVWTQVYGSRSKAGTSKNTFWIGYVGAHYFIDDNTLVGIAGQLDWADETNSTAGSNAEGQGWMIGPYIAGQVEDQNLFYEARAAYGQSDNDLAIGGATGSFDTTRWLVSGKLSGNIKKDDYTITPSISVAYFEETQEAYTDSAATAVPEQTVSLGEVRFGPTLSKAMELDNGTQFTPKLGISGVWNFGVDNNNATQGSVLGDDDLRARIDAGFAVTNPDTGTIFTLEAFYDGIGDSDYDSYGGTARIIIPLQ